LSLKDTINKVTTKKILKDTKSVIKILKDTKSVNRSYFNKKKNFDFKQKFSSKNCIIKAQKYGNDLLICCMRFVKT
jgi:hypothetical protein